MPTSTAAAPTKLWRIATSCGIEVMPTRAASSAPMAPPTTERDRHHHVAVDAWTKRRHQHRDQHAGHAEQVAAARRFLLRQAVEAENKQQAGGQVRDRDEGLRHANGLCHLRHLSPSA